MTQVNDRVTLNRTPGVSTRAITLQVVILSEAKGPQRSIISDTAEPFRYTNTAISQSAPTIEGSKQ